MPFLNVNGASLCYTKTGSGDHSIIFIHGGNGGMLSSIAGIGDLAGIAASNTAPMTVAGEDSMYGSCIKAIQAPNRTIVAYDRRCAGASEYTIEKYYSLADIAADTVELARKLGINDCTVVGTSMGGPVALYIALHHPDFCRNLVVLNSHPALCAGGLPFSNDETRMQRVREMMALNPLQQREYFNSRNHSQKMRSQALVDVDSGGANMERVRETVKNLTDDELFTFWSGNNHNLFAYIDEDLTPDLPRITCPTLIVHGDADDVIPYEGAVMIDHGIAHATLHTIQGAKHGVAGMQECQRVLRKWLEEQEEKQGEPRSAKSRSYL